MSDVGNNVSELSELSELSERCSTCAFCLARPDMKNIWYCVKHNFVIFDINQCCSKFKRKKYKEKR